MTIKGRSSLISFTETPMAFKILIKITAVAYKPIGIIAKINSKKNNKINAAKIGESCKRITNAKITKEFIAQCKQIDDKIPLLTAIYPRKRPRTVA